MDRRSFSSRSNDANIPRRATSLNTSFYTGPRNSVTLNPNPLWTINSDHSDTYHRSLWQKKYSKTQHAERSDSIVKTSKLTSSWIERVFQKRECVKFIHDGSSDKCGCGRSSSSHSRLALSRFTTSMIKSSNTTATMPEYTDYSSTMPLTFKNIHPASIGSGSIGAPPTKWNIAEHTTASPTDAFGTIEFQGGPHPHKAHYLRLAFDSKPADVVHLMEKVWNLPKPQLVITIHGGITNFRLADSFGRRLREGLLKAAQTTGAWIITSGINTGVVRHVAKALDEAGISARMRSQILLIGIAPWGLVSRREKLVGIDAQVTYEHPSYSSRNRHHPLLNDRHSYFLLVDNGTVGRYGADIILRKRFEDYIAQKVKLKCGPERIPLIGLTIEGGLGTINAVLTYLKGRPAIPVIVCAGSGRASDFIAYAVANLDSNGNLSSAHRNYLMCQLKDKLNYNRISTDAIAELIIDCARHKDLLTIYRASDDENKDVDVDQVILRALLRSQGLSAVEQLSLALAWNRVDMARSEVFSTGLTIQPQTLYPAMMNALLLSRVDFCTLLIEQGVSMKKFLTINRLEQLYNAEPGDLAILHHLIGGVDRSATNGLFTLPEIGVAIERLMGNAYKCHYTTRAFKNKYEKFKHKGQLSRISSHLRLTKKPDIKSERRRHQSTTSSGDQFEDFAYPFNELMLWAVLTRRHELAKCMWNHGEEAMAKALVAIRLYKCMSREAADDYTEVEVSNQLREYAEDFRESSFDLLNHCYQQDENLTMRMLTAELPNWGNQTCMSLAVIANNKQLLTHPCCQVLLAELWHGGLRFRSQSNVKVVLAILFPPTILLLDFKKPSYEARGLRPQVNEDDGENDGDDMLQNLKSSVSQLFRTNTTPSKTIRRPILLQPRGLSRLQTEEEEELTTHTPLSPEVTIEEKRVQIQPNTIDIDGLSESSIFDSRFIDDIYVPPKSWRSTIKENLDKFVIFYRAPITSFWIWALSFTIFLFQFIYVVLIEFKAELTYTEWYLLAYVIGLSCEHFRKLLITESSSEWEKFRVFYSRYWNILTTIAIVTFYFGFAFRFDKETIHTHSRIILASNSVLWHMKLYDFLSVHPRMGPYITMAGKMVVAMSYIIVMLLVTLMAFGVAKQSITFPHEKWSWILVRNVFYKPYFMLYGEVYAGEIDTCGDEGTNCVPGSWIPPIIMTIFLLVANILLVNMLIAIFNNIFNVTNAMSHQVWMFQRYDQVLEYQSTPIVPPPFTPIVHLYQILKYLARRFSCRPQKSSRTRDQRLDLAIKMPLDDLEMKKLHDFEEDCMDDLARRLKHSPTFHPRQTVHTEKPIEKGLHELNQMRAEFERLETKIDALEENQYQILSLLHSLVPANAKPEVSEPKLRRVKRPTTLPATPLDTVDVEEVFKAAATATGADIRIPGRFRRRPSTSFTEDMEQMASMTPDVWREEDEDDDDENIIEFAKHREAYGSSSIMDNDSETRQVSSAVSPSEKSLRSRSSSESSDAVSVGSVHRLVGS
uniref:LSDAT_euk domain-containing protein n=1 Tax=Panagrellus redivivus TaxID=6233 RepID=A0A7E4V9N2_PANRE